MNLGIYGSSAAMSGLERWQAMLAQNVAAGQVNGYKRAEVIFESESAQMRGEGAEDITGNKSLGIIPEVNSMRNFSEGQIHQTENPLDFAISGEGYFQLESESGEMLYTRDGQFHLNGEGRLVDKNGNSLVSAGGTIDGNANGGPLHLDTGGGIFQDGVEIGKLEILSPENPNAMLRVSGGFRESEAGAAGLVLSEEAKVVQGALELSNVNPVREMVDMISVARAYEANQRIISNADDMLGKAIQSLGAA